MTFHEKAAWVMAIVLLIAGGYYIKDVIDTSHLLGATAPPNVAQLIAYTALIVILSIFGHTVAAAIAPSDADDQRDERDRLILDKAGNISGWALGIIAVAGLFKYVQANDGNLLFHIILMSLFVSQIIEYFVQIWLYRRGV